LKQRDELVVQDVIQKNPSTLLEGREVLKELKKLQANVDTVHSQQLLQKFYVQLCVAPYIAAERIEEPYGPREVPNPSPVLCGLLTDMCRWQLLWKRSRRISDRL